jgi:hypothetical protein
MSGVLWGRRSPVHGPLATPEAIAREPVPFRHGSVRDGHLGALATLADRRQAFETGAPISE